MGLLKNVKVSVKLLLSFIAVIVLSIVVGVVGILGMSQINQGSSELYYQQVVPITDLGYAREYFQRLRSDQRNLVLASGDMQWISSIRNSINVHEAQFIHYMNEFEGTIQRDDVRQAHTSAMNAFRDYMSSMAEIQAGAEAAMPTYALIQVMNSATPHANALAENLSVITEIRIIDARGKYYENLSIFSSMRTVIIISIIVAAATSVLLSLKVSSYITKPLLTLTLFMEEAAKSGDLEVKPEEIALFDKFKDVNDELGRCITATEEFIAEINHEIEGLESIAAGDLSFTPNILSERDKIGNSLTVVVDSLNEMFATIGKTAQQVSSGANQISGGAQVLAQGSTEQAATIEELAASASEISKKTKENVTIAKEAAKFSDDIKQSAERGTAQMEQMMEAVKEINSASAEINKVIKTIDDIAFQTNILALNAAVEAARAGQHGKGFAVVAEEVRNLAAKSAEAAKSTSGLIENSVSKAGLGMSIANETSSSLQDIVSGINKSAEIIETIASSSDEQSISIEQLNIGIDQVTQVVQQNTATAEESAAASQEMLERSNALEHLIDRFKLKESAERQLDKPVEARPAHKPLHKPQLHQPQQHQSAPQGSDSYNDFAKY